MVAIRRYVNYVVCMGNQQTVWVEGWNADDEYISDSSWVREGETEDDAIERVKAINGIIEIGQVEVTYG